MGQKASLTRGKKTPGITGLMPMSKDLKTELLPKLRVRSARRSREGKSRILDQLCEDHGYEHKYAGKVLRGTVPPASGRKPSGREPRDTLIEQVVRTIRPVAEQPCGKRPAPALLQWRPITSGITASFPAASAGCCRKSAWSPVSRMDESVKAKTGMLFGNNT